MIGTRIILKDRKPLQELLPLESPLVLFIDPSDKCCLKCSFCPSSDIGLMKSVGRPLQCMDFDLYKDIIDGLSKFKTKIKVVRLYSHGEPLLNKNFANMVRYAKNSGKVEMVDTTTNAICLNKKLSLDIVDAGIDRINISINGVNEEQYQSFTGTKIHFNTLVENIKFLYENRKQCYLFIKINGDVISKEDCDKFLEIFEPISDSLAIEHAMNCWEGFESDVKENKEIGIYGQPLQKEPLTCPYTQYSIAVQSSGLVSKCFLDWGLNMVVGDCNKETIYDIWNGKVVNGYQTMMLEGKRKSDKYCKNCSQLIYGQASDIDEYSKEILEKRKCANG